MDPLLSLRLASLEKGPPVDVGPQGFRRPAEAGGRVSPKHTIVIRDGLGGRRPPYQRNGGPADGVQGAASAPARPWHHLRQARVPGARPKDEGPPPGAACASMRPMKAYLAVTGTIFAMLAVAHLFRTIAAWPRLSAEPGLILEGPGIGLLPQARRHPVQEGARCRRELRHLGGPRLSR
jgi:hypothetical protein